MKYIGKISVLAFLILFTGCNQLCDCDKTQNTLSYGEPESVGMSAERLSRIDTVVNQYIENKWIPGGVAFIARKGKIVYHKSFGMRDIENNDPLEKDDIFRIASMTKALTSVCVMMLYEEGNFLLDDPVSKYIPEFKNPHVLVSFNPKDSSFTSRPASREITIRDLLRHTSGIDYMFVHKELSPIYEKAGVADGIYKTDLSLEKAIKILAELPLLHDPGEKFTYGLNTDVLGYLVQVVSGKSFGDFMQERLLTPLGMDDTYFYLPDDKADRLAIIYSNLKDGELKKSENTRFDYPIEGKKLYESGGAGLSSTIFDYAKFMQMLINGGSYNGYQILGRKTIELMTINQVGDLRGNDQFGLGFELTTDKNIGKALNSIGSYTWGGYFSTKYWLDPKEELICLFFTQMQPSRHGEIHDKFHVMTYQALK